MNFDEIKFIGKSFNALTEKKIREVVLSDSIAIVTKIEMEFYDGRGYGIDFVYRFKGVCYDKRLTEYNEFEYAANSYEVDNFKQFLEQFKEYSGNFIVNGDTLVEIKDEAEWIELKCRLLGSDRLARMFTEFNELNPYYVGNCNDGPWFITQYICRRIAMKRANVKEVTSEFAFKLLASNPTAKEGLYEPKGKFFVYEEKDGKPLYTALDNENGCCWTEDFNSFNECLSYLVGEGVSYG